MLEVFQEALYENREVDYGRLCACWSYTLFLHHSQTTAYSYMHVNSLAKHTSLL